MRKIILVFVGIAISISTFSQQADPILVSPGGDSFKNRNHTLDWSIGESVTGILNEGNYTISQGFHVCANYLISNDKSLRGVSTNTERLNEKSTR